MRHLTTLGLAATCAMLMSVFGTLTPSGLVRPLTPNSAASIRGGADCYTDGTANCPTGSSCAVTACKNFSCPANTTANNQSKPNYPFAVLTNDAGKAGTTPGTPFNCLVQIGCSGCSINGASIVCKDGAANGTQSASRIPTTASGDNCNNG